MRKSSGEALSPKDIESLERQIVEDAEADRPDAARQGMEALLKAQPRQTEAVLALFRILDKECLGRDVAVEVVSALADAHADSVKVTIWLGDILECVLDIDDLNRPPPPNTVFRSLVERLKAFAADHAGQADEEAILMSLSTAARLIGRQEDEIAERSYRRLLEIDPKSSRHHYNLGLFCKTRGRFEEGMKANQAAADLVDEPQENHQWNLGICATGAGHGEVALEVWKPMVNSIEMGRFDLPEGRFPQTKVKLAQRPLAERTAETDDPGSEESIWIERLSPCHGIIRSVLYQDLGVDYGDVILIDGAPITEHIYGDTRVPVFPHLATLIRRNYQVFDFAGTQGRPRQLADASIDLDGDAIVYSHTESFQHLCAACWRNPDIDHERHEPVEKHVVTGRIAAPEDVRPADLLAQLDEAIAKREPSSLYTPDLCLAAGQDRRAAMERRRFDMLIGS